MNPKDYRVTYRSQATRTGGRICFSELIHKETGARVFSAVATRATKKELFASYQYAFQKLENR